MAKYCGKDCEDMGPVCDYCTHFDYNGTQDGVYTGNGFCRNGNKPTEPEFGCDDFECFQYWMPK